MAKKNDEWRKEQAMEAGMLHGVDAYNEVMGFVTGEQENPPFSPDAPEVDEHEDEEGDE